MAAMLAVATPILLAAVGLAVDMGNLYYAHSRLQTAVDAGALAGSLELPYDPNLTKGVVQAKVVSTIDANYPDAVLDNVYSGTEVRSVCVEAHREVQLGLMAAINAILPGQGLVSQTVEAEACAGFNNLEIVLVIDNTGSMNGTPIRKVRQAAGELVDLVIPDGGAPSTKVGLVPFRGKVRLGNNADGQGAGCRNADGTVNETNWYSCFRGIPRTLELSTKKSKIKSAINSMDANRYYSSGTVISEGIKWGRQVLTPEAPFTQGGDDEDYRKIMILLTDGDTEDGKCGGRYAATRDPNSYWYNAYYGMGVTDCHCEPGGCLDNAVLLEADKAKDAGIEIFAVRYGNSDSVDISLMKQVASSKPGTDDHYFDAPSVNDIDDIFKEIGKQLGWRLLN